MPAWAQQETPPTPTDAPGTPVDCVPGEGVLPAECAADDGVAGGANVYYPADFARYSPRNALDMIEQIPGFTLDGGGGPGGGGGGGGGARGFGQASTNLLINGQRLSSKSTDARSELSRIPVSSVVRIEIVEGASLDVPGLSGQVANVIAQTTGMSGQFEYNPHYTFGPADFNWSRGEVSLRGSTGGVDYTLALDARAFNRGAEGPAIFADADGFIDERFNVNTANFKRPTISGSLAFDVAPNVPVNLNGSMERAIFRQGEQEFRIDGNPLPSFDERFRTENDEFNYELSGDITHPIGPGRLKLIGLFSSRHGDRISTALLDLEGEDTSGDRFQRVTDQREKIVRGEYSWGMLGGDWQLSAEGAFNTLDQVGRLFEYDPVGDSFDAVPLPSATGGVREDRYEMILSYGTTLAEGLSLQLAAGGEQSTISQTGTNALSRTFQRPKGSLSLSWTATDDFSVALEVARRVGQLDFGDFLANVNLTEENENSGNNRLRPEQSWETELEFNKGFGPWGSATLGLSYEQIQDYVTIVPVEGGESSGNIDSARSFTVNLDGTLQFEPIGWTGARLDVSVEVERSSLEDPVTFIDRRYDGRRPFEMHLDFRHDVPQTDWAWGWGFEQSDYGPSYRLSQVSLSYDRVATDGRVFVEHKDVLGLVVRAQLENVFDESVFLQRTVYDGPRDTAPVLFTETRRQKGGPMLQLFISGTF